MKKLLLAAAVLVSPVAAMPAHAAQIVLAPTSVVGASGYYTSCCSFQPGNIFDQQTGTVTETFGGGYWLNPDNGPANAYITVDLGASYALSSVSLYNTHNGPYADRGTGNFSIFGSNSVTGGVLDTPTLLVSGTLAAETSGNPAEQNFLASGTFRYLSFNPNSVAVGGSPCCGANNYGLDELRVFGAAAGAVPEPTSWALLIGGFGLVGAASRRRRSTTVYA